MGIKGSLSSKSTIPFKEIAALHACKARVLHAHYTHITRSVHAPYTQMPENGCSFTQSVCVPLEFTIMPEHCITSRENFPFRIYCYLIFFSDFFFPTD